MSRCVDMTGETYGRLTVLHRVGQHNSSGNAIWMCYCVCGKTCKKDRRGLLKSNNPSCGCYNRRNFLDQAFGQYIGQVKKDAEKRGYVFDLNEEEVFRLNQQSCHYCGREPVSVKKVKNTTYIYNGLDRVDNTKGYILENVVTCCKQCNRAKDTMTYSEFIDLVKNIYNNHVKTDY